MQGGEPCTIVKRVQTETHIYARPNVAGANPPGATVLVLPDSGEAASLTDIKHWTNQLEADVDCAAQQSNRANR